MPSKAGPAPHDADSLASFVTGIVGEEKLRVEEDLGCGFVRLKSSEAERRQAAQDIRCTEDIVLEMLRNARDAGARNIFLAIGREGSVRSVVVIDDGGGIPESMHERIFQPRVTSKLDSAKLDKWGIHGRGMALYSISQNAEYAHVLLSSPGRGAAIKVRTEPAKLPERADQSTFPVFEQTDAGYAMRGPRNILRTAAEFAFEHRKELSVFCGSETEVASTLYAHGIRELPASKRLFGGDATDVPHALAPSMAADERSLAASAERLGLDISVRSARRILDGEIAPVPSMMERLEQESFPRPRPLAPAEGGMPQGGRPRHPSRRHVRISPDDLDAFGGESAEAFRALAEKYYLAPADPRVRQRGSKLLVEFDLVEKTS